MSDLLTTALEEATTRTFEDLCFLCAMPELEDEMAGVPTPAFARVDFSGAAKGHMELRVARPLLPVLAQNMLGAFDNVPEEQQSDALGEIANVICGNVLPALGGAAAVFDLGKPVTGIEDGGAVAASNAAAAVRVVLEDGPVTAALYLEGDR
jgi:CheY-specific phosphatase CheX